MRLASPLRMGAVIIGTAILLLAPASARASLTLRISTGSNFDEVSDPTTLGSIDYSKSSFGGLFAIQMLSADSNSSTDGPSALSQLSIDSFKVQNLTGISQTLTISLSDSGFDPDSARHYIVMEYVHGRSGAAILRDRGHLGVQEALAIVVQACHGLDYAPRHGPIHRHVQPGNLLRSDTGPCRLPAVRSPTAA